MNIRRFFLFVFAAAVLFLLAASWPQVVLAQLSPGAPNPAVVHVQVLKLPPKAANAFAKGSNLVLAGNYQASLAPLQKAIELAPDLFPPYHNLAFPSDQ